MRKLIFTLFLALISPAFVSIAHADTMDQTAQTWTKKNFKIKGHWEITNENGQHVLKLDDEFKTRKAPDLKLFLSPLPLAELKNKNAIDGAVLISPLKNHKGAQRYVLADDIDLNQFQTLIIHCEQYTKLWGGASLR